MPVPAEILQRVNAIDAQIVPIKASMLGQDTGKESYIRAQSQLDALNQQRAVVLTAAPELEEKINKAAVNYQLAHSGGINAVAPQAPMGKWTPEELERYAGYSIEDIGKINPNAIATMIPPKDGVGFSAGISEAYKADVAKAGMQINPATGAVEPKPSSAQQANPPKTDVPFNEGRPVSIIGVDVADNQILIKNDAGNQKWVDAEGYSVNNRDLNKAQLQELADQINSAEPPPGGPTTGGLSKQPQAEVDQDQKEFEATHTKLPDGQYMATDTLDALKHSNFKAYTTLTLSGFSAYQKAAEKAENTLSDYKQADGSYEVGKAFMSNDPAVISALYTLFDNNELNTTRNKMLEQGTITAIKSIAQATGLRIKATPAETAKATILEQIPGYGLVENYATMSFGEKVLNVGLLAGSLLLGLGIAKGVSKAGNFADRIQSGVNKAERLATQAGKAGQKLELATANYRTVTGEGVPILDSMFTDKVAAVQNAQKVSMAADRAFLDKLALVQNVEPTDLKTLEIKSGMKGLASAVTDVSKSQNDVEKAWKVVEKTKFNPVITAEDTKGIATNNKHIVALSKLADNQAKLQVALEKAGSTLTPRYKEPPPASTFMGYKAEWIKNKPKLDLSAGVFSQVEDYLKGNTQPGKKAVAIAVAERPTEASRLKLSPIYEAPKKETVKSVATPKVATEFDKTLFFPKSRTVKYESQTKIERLGSMTPEQAAKQMAGEGYQTEGVVSPLIGTKINQSFQAKSSEKMASASRAGTFMENRQSTQTGKNIRQSLQPTTRVGITPSASISTKPQTSPQVKTETEMKVVTKQKKDIDKLITRETTGGEASTTPPPWPKSRKQKAEKTVIAPENRGAIGFQMGRLRRKPVIKIVRQPYRQANLTTTVGTPPEGITITSGKGGPQRSITLISGKAPSKAAKVDIGITRAIITPGGPRRVTLNFERIGTNQRVPTLRFKSTKRGKIFRTNINGRTALSRHSLNK